MKTKNLLLFFLICTLASGLKAAIHTINAGSYYFSPASHTINVGDTVEWINDGGLHDVNADINTLTGSSFNNPVSFQSSATNVTGALIYTHIFTVPGTYNYDCSIGNHAVNGMIGSIIVNTNSIYDIVSNSPDHTTLKVAIDACGLAGFLSDPGSLTLFAPTDAAFNLLPAGTVTALLADIPQLTDILKHHVVNSSVMSSMLSNNQIVTTLNGDVLVTINSVGVFIDNAQVIGPDIVADNGVVHVINAVLLPPVIDCAGIIDGTALVDSCGTCQQAYIYNFQTNVPVFVDNANILVAGVDYDPTTEALIFPDDLSNPLWISDPTLCNTNSIYDIVSNSPDHTTLKAAIDACGLASFLSDPGSLTLFAPTDAAFNLLPAGTVTALLADIPQLTDILKHHVVNSSVMSSMLSNNQIVTTLNGDVLVTINSVGVFIDNAQVTGPDIAADNGVVHVIDAVLLPNTTSVNDLSLNSLKEYLYSVNILGEKINRFVKNQIIFDIYNNGEIVKRFVR